MIINSNSTIDIKKDGNAYGSQEINVTLRRHDSVAYELEYSIRQSGQVFDLTGYTVRFVAQTPSGQVIDNNVEVISARDGLIRYVLPRELTAVAGDIDVAYFAVTNDGSDSYLATTQDIHITVIDGVIFDPQKFFTGDYYPEFLDILHRLQGYEDGFADAEQKRVVAENDRDAAEAERRAAEVERINAEESREDNEHLRNVSEQDRVNAEFDRRKSEALRKVSFKTIDGKINSLMRSFDTLGAMHTEHDALWLAGALHATSMIASFEDGNVTLEANAVVDGTAKLDSNLFVAAI